MNLLRLCDANIFRISSLLIPPPPCLSLGLKTEEGNAVCVWMKLKLEAEWHCSGTGKSSRLPACVCMYVSNGRGSDEEGSVKTFPFGGPQQRKQNFKRDPTQDNPTHTYRDRQISTKGQTCCLSHAEQQKAADLQWAHSGLQMLLKPQKRIFPSHSTTLCLNSQHTDTKVIHENKLYKHP